MDMAHKINLYKQAYEIETHKFTVDASDLQLAPGEWPTQIECVGGNNMPLIRFARNNGEEILYVKYKQANGIIELKIFND